MHGETKYICVAEHTSITEGEATKINVFRFGDDGLCIEMVMNINEIEGVSLYVNGKEVYAESPFSEDNNKIQYHDLDSALAAELGAYELRLSDFFKDTNTGQVHNIMGVHAESTAGYDEGYVETEVLKMKYNITDYSGIRDELGHEENPQQ